MFISKRLGRALCFGLAVLPFVCAGVLVPQAGVGAHHLHGGVSTSAEPQGKNVTIGELDVLTYVSLPRRFKRDEAVVLLTDIFGLPRVDNLLLADEWAAAGFQTYMPDYLFGDAFPEDFSGDIQEWIARHNESATTPLLLSVLDALRRRGISKIAVSGYCFGGLYATRVAQNNTVQVSTMAHPSLLTVPDDFELMQMQSKVPVQVLSAELDTGLTPELAAQVNEVMDGYGPGYDAQAFAGVGHGFAVAADENDPVAVEAKKGSFDAAVSWVKTHFANC